MDGVSFAYLPSGTTVPSPADLLTSSTTAGLVDGLRKFHDWIVIDSPPVGAVGQARRAPSLSAPGDQPFDSRLHGHRLDITEITSEGRAA